jgi:pyruvate formate lyase activating enzyme
MGRFKWHKLGLDYKLEQFVPPTPELVERTIGIYRACGLNAE